LGVDVEAGVTLGTGVDEIDSVGEGGGGESRGEVNTELDGEVGKGEATGAIAVSAGVGFTSPLNRLHPEK